MRLSSNRRRELSSRVKGLASDLDRRDDQGITVRPEERKELQELVQEHATVLGSDKILALKSLEEIRAQIAIVKSSLGTLEHREAEILNEILEIEKDERNDTSQN